MQQATDTFQSLVPPDAQVEQVATSFQFTEGPAWDGKGALYFSDIPGDTIYRLGLDGKVSPFLKPSGKSNGLMFDRDGTLLACRHWTRDVVRIAMDGKLTVLADSFGGKRLNSPNDLIVARDGSIYFTDPHYGLEGRPQEQPLEGVYRLAPGGALTLVIRDMTRPNGLAISPDGKTLYVADSQDKKLRAYRLAPDGSAAQGRDFLDMSADGKSVPDGMALDSQGNIYCTGAGIWVITPEGQVLGRIPVPEVPANCEFGGPENRDLYLTAQHSVYRIRLNARGLR